MILLKERRVIEIHNPKTGGESRATFLKHYACNGDIVREDKDWQKHEFASKLFEIFPLESGLEWNDCYSYMFVRNPWDQIHSNWWMIQDLWQKAKAEGFGIEDVPNWVSLDCLLSFESYVRKLGDGERHFPTIEQLAYDDCYDKLVKKFFWYENFDKSWLEICSAVGLPKRRLGNVNFRGKRPHRREVYNPVTRDIVAEMRVFDIEHLGYKF